MSEWKTMLEVARDLGVSKRVIKYHKEKLSSANKTPVRTSERFMP